MQGLRIFCTFAVRMRKNGLHTGLWALVMAVMTVMLLGACSETKYVPEGQYLLNKAKVVVDKPQGVKGKSSEQVSAAALKPYVVQRGNSRWFSTAKIPLKTYSLSGRDTTRWLNRLLRNMGEAPQLYDTVFCSVLKLQFVHFFMVFCSL